MKKVNELRIIIAGGRDFTDYETLAKETSRVIQSLLPECKLSENNVRIVSGHARGADSLGERFAVDSGFDLTMFPANWLKHGKSAGPIRNQIMLEYATENNCLGYLIAFWDGKSKGTKNMIDVAEKCGIDVYVCLY